MSGRQQGDHALGVDGAPSPSRRRQHADDGTLDLLNVMGGDHRRRYPRRAGEVVQLAGAVLGAAEGSEDIGVDLGDVDLGRHAETVTVSVGWVIGAMTRAIDGFLSGPGHR